jgi:hypothetical protein
VTYYLKSKQLDKATESKSLLEQRQREGAKERAEKSIKWQTKVIQITKQSTIKFFRFSILLNQVNRNGHTNIN